MSDQIIDLQPEQILVVERVLARYLPISSQVWVFGSRAKGTARKYSDLDLVVDLLGSPISGDILADLAIAFEQSELPFAVDIVDWNSIGNEFRQAIENQRILLSVNR